MVMMSEMGVPALGDIARLISQDVICSLHLHILTVAGAGRGLTFRKNSARNGCRNVWETMLL
jgi:hypothetical protein